MSKNSFRFILIIALSLAAFASLSSRIAAQQKKAKIPDSVNDPLVEGRALYLQRCIVCHSTARKAYGPMLTKDIVIDREDEVRQQIEQGSALMPAFQFGLKSAQIDSIISYLKTVQPPAKKIGTNNVDLPD